MVKPSINIISTHVSQDLGNIVIPFAIHIPGQEVDHAVVDQYIHAELQKSSRVLPVQLTQTNSIRANQFSVASDDSSVEIITPPPCNSTARTQNQSNHSSAVSISPISIPDLSDLKIAMKQSEG